MHLREGIRVNNENLPLSGDMQLIIDRCIPLMNAGDGGEAASETSLILGQFSRKDRH